MTSLLDNPLIQSAILPLLLSLGLTGLLRVVLGQTFGPRLASTALVLSFLTCLALIQTPVYPPRASSQKLPYLVAGAALLGLLIDILNLKTRLQQLALAALALVTLGWLLGDHVSRIDLAGWLLIPILFAAALLTQQRCMTRRDTLDGGILLLFAGGGIGAIALLGASASLGQTGFALMAAIGGFLLWNWPTRRFPFAAVAQLGAITALLAMSTQLLFFTQANGWSLLLLLPLLLIDRVGHGMKRPHLRAIGVTGAAAVVCALAVTSAWLMTDTSGYGY